MRLLLHPAFPFKYIQAAAISPLHIQAAAILSPSYTCCSNPLSSYTGCSNPLPSYTGCSNPASLHIFSWFLFFPLSALILYPTLLQLKQWIYLVLAVDFDLHGLEGDFKMHCADRVKYFNYDVDCLQRKQQITTKCILIVNHRSATLTFYHIDDICRK